LKGNLKFMAMKWNSTVDRQQCELTGTKSAREFRQKAVGRGVPTAPTIRIFNHPGNKADSLENCSI